MTANQEHPLKVLRGLLGLTQKELAVELSEIEKVTQSFIARVESGNVAVSPKLSKSLVALYGAWIPPELNPDGVFEAFGENWSSEIARMQLQGKVCFASDYANLEDMAKAVGVISKSGAYTNAVKLRGVTVFKKRPQLSTYSSVSQVNVEVDQAIGSRDEERESSEVAGRMRRSIDAISRITCAELLDEKHLSISQIEKNYALLIKAFASVLEQTSETEHTLDVFSGLQDSLIKMFPGAEDVEKLKWEFALDTDKHDAVMKREGLKELQSLPLGEIRVPTGRGPYKNWAERGMSGETWLRGYKALMLKKTR